MFAAYLPPSVASAVVRSARETYAGAALDSAETLCGEDETTGVLNQVREALRFSRSPRVVARAARVAARWLARRMRRPHASAHA